MNMFKTLAVATVAGACVLAVPSQADARSSYGFSISTGGPGDYAPAPYYAPPPPPVYYAPAPGYAYPAYPAYYHRPAPSFSFSYFGR